MANEHSQTSADQAGFLPGRAMFQIVAGQPSAEEVAAVTVALRAKLALSAQSEPSHQRLGTWADRSRLLRLAISPGPNAWRRSALPR